MRRGADVGSSFQEAINRTNEAYEKSGIACITRKAIPGKYVMPRDRRRGLALPSVDGLSNIQSGTRIKATDLHLILKGNSSDPRAFIPESRAEPDYGGCISPNGRAIFYDAKSTRREQLDFDNLHAHQVTFLERTASSGAISGFLVEFSAHREVYFLPIQVLTKFRSVSNRKSVPYKFIAKYLVSVCAGQGFIIYDYLQAIRAQETLYGKIFEKFSIEIM